jgi:exodeoxyribonuclease VII large subunit
VTTVVGVSQVNYYIKSLLDYDIVLSDLAVRGEVSNFKAHDSGHLYFSLRDENASLRCVCFKGDARGLGFLPKNGDAVEAAGRISAYEKTGEYQLYVNAVTLTGRGGLHDDFERVKGRLLAEGLFEAERKRPVPRYCLSVAVVTAPAGAVIHDIINVISRRNRFIRVTLAPARVQGEGAAEDVARALREVNEWGGADCVIVGRGGGSNEDLSAFNEEIVARSIAASKIPVISAVGHETDFTIADMAADLRAPTPSAAAEIAAFPEADFSAFVRRQAARARAAVERRISGCSEETDGLWARVARVPGDAVKKRREALFFALKRAEAAAFHRIELEKAKVRAFAAVAEANSPQRALSRGYALIRGERGAVLRAEELHAGDAVSVELKGGKAEARIISVSRNSDSINEFNAKS